MTDIEFPTDGASAHLLVGVGVQHTAVYLVFFSNWAAPTSSHAVVVVGCCGTVITPGIQLKVDGELCAVHPSDLLQDLVPEHVKVWTKEDAPPTRGSWMFRSTNFMPLHRRPHHTHFWQHLNISRTRTFLTWPSGVCLFRKSCLWPSAREVRASSPQPQPRPR